MNRSTVLYFLLFAGAAGVYLWLHHKAQQTGAPADQTAGAQEAANAAQYYAVPPSVGAQVDSTGGLNFPNGIPDNTTFQFTQAQPMPLPVGTSPTSGNT